MALLKELFDKLKEQDITFSRGDVEPTPTDTPPDAELGEPGAGPELGADEYGGHDDDDGMGMGDDDDMGDDDVVTFELPALIRALTAAQSFDSEDAVHEFVEKLIDGEQEDVITVDCVEDALGDGDGDDDGLGDDFDSDDDLDDDDDDDPDMDGLGGDDTEELGGVRSSSPSDQHPENIPPSGI